VTFASEITVAVQVEVVDYTRATTGRFFDRPERSAPTEPAELELAVRLGSLDITHAVPADVLDALRAEALEQFAER
jgi:hypothetical protein